MRRFETSHTQGGAGEGLVEGSGKERMHIFFGHDGKNSDTGEDVTLHRESRDQMLKYCSHGFSVLDG